MTAKRELLEAEDAGWHRICDLFHRIPEDGFTRPGVNDIWSAKDLMAHVAAWHALTTDLFEAMRTGGDMPPRPDTDAFNEDSYQRCKDLSAHDVRAMFESARHRFREEIQLLPDELDEFFTGVIVGNGHGHYDEHIPQLTSFLGGS